MLWQGLDWGNQYDIHKYKSLQSCPDAIDFDRTLSDHLCFGKALTRVISMTYI